MGKEKLLNPPPNLPLGYKREEIIKSPFSKGGEKYPYGYPYGFPYG